MCARLVVLISGSGTNLQAILDAREQLAAEVVLVVSNRKAAFGLRRAADVGVPTLYFPLKPFVEAGGTREGYDSALADRIAACHPDLIVLAGWMHVLSPAFLDRFPRRVINLHPALPGTFPGTEAIRRAYEANQRGEISESGCMVHYAVPEVDAGAVIAQTRLPFIAGEALADFEARMHAAEHRVIVEAIGRLTL